MLIGDNNTFSLITGTGKGSESGGGKFVADTSGGGAIFLEPAMFPQQTGDVVGTAEIALVHEIGHTMIQLFPKYFEKANAKLSGQDFVLYRRGEGFTVNFENRYRRSIGADIRHSYASNLLDPILDFGVKLFPPE